MAMEVAIGACRWNLSIWIEDGMLNMGPAWPFQSQNEVQRSPAVALNELAKVSADFGE